MDFGLTGKVALVAAGSAGLGRAASYSLAAEGARVALCSRDPARVEAAVADLRAATGGEVVGFVADLNQADGAARFAEQATAALGSASILVTNNGGPPPGAAMALREGGWREALDSTVLSAVRLVHETLSSMRDVGWGRVVHISSIGVRQPIPNLAASNGSRAALAAWSKTLSREVAGQGVTVNTVCPGPFATQRSEEVLAARAEAEQRPIEDLRVEAAQAIPIGRLGEPAELGAMIAFLCSAQAGFVTGATIPVDGGLGSGLL